MGAIFSRGRPDRAFTTEDNAISINALANDRGLNRVFSVDTRRTKGDVEIDAVNNTVTYDPGDAFQSLAAGQRATDTFFYTAGFGSVEIPQPIRVFVLIRGQNDAPLATDDEFSTSADQIFKAKVLANDSDVDRGDRLRVLEVEGDSGLVGTSVALPSGANLIMPLNGLFRYDPNGAFDDLVVGETATDHFEYTAVDRRGATDTATVEVTVTGVGEPSLDVLTSDLDGVPGNVVLLNDGSGQFTGTGQNVGGSSRDVDLADMDGDGDLDAVLGANPAADNGIRVWLNDGAGNFSDTGQAILAGAGRRAGEGLDVGDVDGDNDLDVVVNGRFMPLAVLHNDGNGNLTVGQQESPGSDFAGRSPKLGDLDGDDDLDLVNTTGFAGNRVYLNDGTGTFALVQTLPGNTNDNALGDIDGDGDLDIVLVNVNQGANQVWKNDGSGTFVLSQSFNTGNTARLAMADLDDDDDLDLFLPQNGADEVWLNDGSGNFTDSGQTLGNENSVGIGLGDLDGDGDVDAYVGGIGPAADRVWLNDGSALFTDSGQMIGAGDTFEVALGFLDDMLIA